MPSSLNIVATVTPDTVTNSISQVGHGLAVGDVIRRDSGGSYVKALGDSLVNSLAIGVVSQIVSTDAFKFIQVGLINGLSGLVDGSQYYLSRDTAGALVATTTSTDGEVNKPILNAISTTSGYVDIKKSDVVAAAASAGNFEFVETRDLSGLANPPSLDFTTIPAGYIHRFIYENLTNLTGGNNTFIRCSTNAGVSYDATSAYLHALQILQTGGTQDNRTGSQTGVHLCGTSNNGTAAASGLTGWTDVLVTNTAGERVTFLCNQFCHTSPRGIVGQVYYNNTSAVNALQIIPEGGNMGSVGKVHHMRLKLSA